MEIELHTKGPQGEPLTLQGAISWYNKLGSALIIKMSNKYNVSPPTQSESDEVKKSYILGLYIHTVVKETKERRIEELKKHKEKVRMHGSQEVRRKQKEIFERQQREAIREYERKWCRSQQQNFREGGRAHYGY